MSRVSRSRHSRTSGQSPRAKAKDIRLLLARAARGDEAPWPPEWTSAADEAAVSEAILYHGVAGLLAEQAGSLDDWPEGVIAALHSQATGQAMWEIRHRLKLTELTEALGKAGVKAVFMKGTAIAYELYEQPAARARGDSDLLVDRAQLEVARQNLQALGYAAPGVTDRLALQENWTLVCENGLRHDIDLHWAPLNSPALKEVLATQECLSGASPLPRLAAAAWTMDRPRLLLHTCLHRAMHRTAPYFVGSGTYFGEDRLIWSSDLSLLCAAFSPSEWQQFTRLAIATGSAGACLSGLEAAMRDFCATVPETVLADLRGDGSARRHAYLSGSRSITRALQDAAAVQGILPKFHYLRTRLFPSAAFMRAKYPAMAGSPLPLLYARRLADSLRRRTANPSS